MLQAIKKATTHVETVFLLVIVSHEFSMMHSRGVLMYLLLPNILCHTPRARGKTPSLLARRAGQPIRVAKPTK